ncbi:hypothetical protein LTR85_009254 [Meristemomyces frigidus]|nr:hypothetical protein LTR85_009254 [Meristemomyces frigidus]
MIGKTNKLDSERTLGAELACEEPAMGIAIAPSLYNGDPTSQLLRYLVNDEPARHQADNRVDVIRLVYKDAQHDAKLIELNLRNKVRSFIQVCWSMAQETSHPGECSGRRDQGL